MTTESFLNAGAGLIWVMLKRRLWIVECGLSRVVTIHTQRSASTIDESRTRSLEHRCREERRASSPATRDVRDSCAFRHTSTAPADQEPELGRILPFLSVKTPAQTTPALAATLEELGV